ncbi:CheY-like chemotaxis protein/Flp pilus assembly protein TadD [Chitinivorax tropicus]|uniref:CheY-like chemotaxis protein/Flp pilus assembly protein TadD n=1 Tax=Chitinivorax tropicus TaxID=714531 RepID=A0A840MKN6_9PROT|nr:tetratricopeptide repeat protein [Chitinivorax tropicus]MBB5017126.1 CheY-like chemotaxis protein/Flp pilus assembly protein TadD [Chitinivorax tropicus]
MISPLSQLPTAVNRLPNALTDIALQNSRQMDDPHHEQINYAQQLFLVVDNVPEMRQSMAFTLSAIGANKVEFATRVGDALAKIQKQDIDIILCDYDLEHPADGLHLIEEIKLRNLAKQSCVFMIITGERRAQNVIGAVEQAPDDYLLKPFTGDALIRRLDRAIRKKREFECVDDFILRHEYLRAIEECNRHIRNKHQYALDFMKLKGRMCLQIGDHEAARQTYKQVLLVKPLAWAKMGLGKSEFHLKHYALAEQLFNEVLEENGQVMEAYDWLSKILAAQGEFERAQHVLQNAVRISPTIVQRQKQLGSLAHRNKDYGVAEQALKQTIQLARYSFWRDPGDYADLSRVQLDKGDIKAAQQTVSEVRKDFPKDPNAVMVSYVMESLVSGKAGDKNAAHTALELAQKQFQLLGGEVPERYTLDLAEACYRAGDEAQAEQLVRGVLKNRNEDNDILNRISGLYESIGRTEKGQILIEEANADLISINNQAVTLAKAGNLEGAVQLFIQAVTDMPANVQVTLNSINALLAYVNTQGWHASYMQLAKEYLEKVRKQEPSNGKYQRLVQTYQQTLIRHADKLRGGR